MTTPVQRKAVSIDSSSLPPDEPGTATQGSWTAQDAVQRVAEPAEEAAASTASSVGRVAAAAPPAAHEPDLDALAGRLYDRIRTRLKTELLVDRERAGFLTDLR